MEPVFIDISVRVCGSEKVDAKWKDKSAYTKILLKENTEDIRYTRKWMENNFMTSDEECGLEIFLAPFERGQKRLADSKWTDFVSIEEETGDIVINHHVDGEPKEMPKGINKGTLSIWLRARSMGGVEDAREIKVEFKLPGKPPKFEEGLKKRFNIRVNENKEDQPKEFYYESGIATDENEDEFVINYKIRPRPPCNCLRPGKKGKVFTFKADMTKIT